MQNLPAYIVILFIVTTAATLFFLYRATGKSRIVLLGSLGWLALQGVVGYSGFYLQSLSLPPRFLLLVGPPLVFIILLALTPKGKSLIDKTDPVYLTLLHVVRIPVELCLLALYLYGKAPELMTFEGRNFDVLSGISAIFIFYYGYVRARLSRRLLLAWNIICLCLLFNIVGHAVLSMPTPFQQLAFDQPNTGLLYFPFVWLPAFIVPAVLFSHIALIRQLIYNTPDEVPALMRS